MLTEDSRQEGKPYKVFKNILFICISFRVFKKTFVHQIIEQKQDTLGLLTDLLEKKINQLVRESSYGLKKNCMFADFPKPKFLFLGSSLAKYDLIVTTYGTVMSEMKSVLAKSRDVKLDDMVTVDDEGNDAKNVQLLSVIWERIILDEAHQIRNPKSQTALAVCK